MMKKRLLSMVLLCAMVAMFISHSPEAQANSAQKYWSGVSAIGTFVTDENCPIVVEKELLTFDVKEFPQNYYDDHSSYLSYDGKVTAEYHFYNPSDYTVTATLVFPFGSTPDYGYIYDDEKGQYVHNADTDKYDLLLDGLPMERALRHTFGFKYDFFEVEKDMAKLHDAYIDDAFYVPGLPVTKYTYSVSGIPEEDFHAATAAFKLSGDGKKSKFLLEDQGGCSTLDDGIMMNLWVRNDQTCTLYVFGDQPQQMPQWNVYENGTCEEEIAGSVELISTVNMTFEEFALLSYDENCGVLKHDWYNAMIEMLREIEWSHGGLVNTGYDYNYSFVNYLMRWYEYELTLAPGERIVNTVTAPLYPSINSMYMPALYNYEYLLSPAATWADFGALEIVINTPFFLISAEGYDFAKADGGYSISLDGLPEGELSFVLSASANPAREKRGLFDYLPIELFISSLVILAVIAVAGGIVLFIVFRRRKRAGKK